MEAKIIQIGNSKGIRLPKKLLAKYRLSETVTIKEVAGGILIAPSGADKLSWEDTYKAIEASDEDWADWTDLDIGELHEDR